jgi:hypothetical protein
MRNYSRRFRRNYRGGNPLDGLLGSSDPNKKVQDAQAQLDKAKEELSQSQAKAAAPSTGFKIPFLSGGAPPNNVQTATNSVTSGVNSGVKALGSGVNSLTSGISSMLPKMNGGRQSRRRSKKNRRSRRR